MAPRHRPVSVGATEADPVEAVKAKDSVSRRLIWRWAVGVGTVAAAVLLIRQFDGIDMTSLYHKADPTWAGIALALSLLPLLGAAVGLLAVSPTRLPIPATLAVQLATSFTNLVTPASVGSSALIVRFIQRRCSSLPGALAAMALLHVTSVMGSAAVIVVALVAAGRRIEIGDRIGGTGIVIGAAVAVALGVALWWLNRHRGVWAERVRSGAVETWRQFVQALRHPVRVVGGIGSGLLVLLGQTFVLVACLNTYDEHLAVLNVALVLTVGTAVGATAPVPGGIGATEASLAAGLIFAGASPETAVLAALLYRILVFWARIPFGWGCLMWLRKAKHV